MVSKRNGVILKEKISIIVVKVALHRIMGMKLEKGSS